MTAEERAEWTTWLDNRHPDDKLQVTHSIASALLADLAAAEAERDRLQHGLDDAIDEIASLKRHRDMLLSDRSKLDLRVAHLGQVVDAGLEERDGLEQQVARLEHEARGAAEASEADRLVRDRAHVMLGQISGIVQPGDGELLVPAVQRLREENDRLRPALSERADEVLRHRIAWCRVPHVYGHGYHGGVGEVLIVEQRDEPTHETEVCARMGGRCASPGEESTP